MILVLCAWCPRAKLLPPHLAAFLRCLALQCLRRPPGQHPQLRYLVSLSLSLSGAGGRRNARWRCNKEHNSLMRTCVGGAFTTPGPELDYGTEELVLTTEHPFKGNRDGCEVMNAQGCVRLCLMRRRRTLWFLVRKGLGKCKLKSIFFRVGFWLVSYVFS